MLVKKETVECQSYQISMLRFPIALGCSFEIGSRLYPLGDFSRQWLQEAEWLTHLREQSGNLHEAITVAWSAYHGSRSSDRSLLKAINVLLPLFFEKSTSIPMLRHGMNIVRNITKYLNGDQIPVICVDQLLYALMKKIQWSWPQEYGEDKFIVLLGPLHIEQWFLRILGQFMEGSGWTTIVSHAGITTAGSAEAMMKLRQGDFDLFRETLKQMAPWYFLFDHQNYARYLTVHIQDLEELPSKAPDIHKEFLLKKFVLPITENPDSYLAIDHAHKQNNAKVKGNGGAVGLTSDPSALRRWTIGGPEICRLLNEFNHSEDADDDEVPISRTHHEQTKSYQSRFADHFAALKDAFLTYENPFSVQGTELVAIDSSVVVGTDAVQTLYDAVEKSESMYKSFVDERLVEKSRSLYDPIRKCMTKIFTHQKKTATSPMKALKSDVQLYSRLFIVCISRELDLDIFFQHENQLYPPSLSLNGSMRTGNKSQLVAILENLLKKLPEVDPPHRCEGLIIDGAVLVHNIKPRPDVKTFKSYVGQLISNIGYTRTQMEIFRVDIAWDLYSCSSLKEATRSSRGTGVRRKDLPNKSTLLTNWDDYLRNDHNKQELFSFLANEILKELKDVEVVTNVDDVIRSSEGTQSYLQGVSCAAMEEADGRLMLHVNDMVENGIRCIVIRSSDTDVLVLTVSHYHALHRKGLRELWLHFGAGLKRRFISVHGIAGVLGEDTSIALRGFHAFTGCDTVSFFGSRGKQSAWNAFLNCSKREDIILAFKKLSHPMLEDTIDDDLIKTLERFTVYMYGIRDETCSGVNEARKHMFATENKHIGAIPPSLEAFVQHMKRAAFQSGHIWGRALENSLPPSPEGWGWKKEGDTWVPLWSELPEIWSACRALDKCGCKSGCDTKRCSCRRNILPCYLGCTSCKGECSNKKTQTQLEPHSHQNEEEEVDGGVN
ncbi:unnamed protein product [Phaedon cochleariae]|uniref:Tesmin/TSO1-like CXC domain-containing protein n=1 Tax=Phaedon cochleariae TaxID=80249 RepID=A0A9N9X1P0_PHACE|nr:unnamed protein product [Phaedon cochleariae]